MAYVVKQINYNGEIINSKESFIKYNFEQKPIKFGYISQDLRSIGKNIMFNEKDNILIGQTGIYEFSFLDRKSSAPSYSSVSIPQGIPCIINYVYEED